MLPWQGHSKRCDPEQHGSHGPLVLGHIETPIQEILDRPLLEVVVHGSGVHDASEALGGAGVEEVVAGPPGLDHEGDAEHPPAPVQELPSVDVVRTLDLGFLIHAQSSRYRCCHGHTHDHPGPRNTAPMRVKTRAATASTVNTTTTIFRSRLRQPLLRSRNGRATRNSNAAPGTRTPATIG